MSAASDLRRTLPTRRRACLRRAPPITMNQSYPSANPATLKIIFRITYDFHRRRNCSHEGLSRRLIKMKVGRRVEVSSDVGRGSCRQRSCTIVIQAEAESTPVAVCSPPLHHHQHYHKFSSAYLGGD
ncbi:hypothetical protein E2C01_101026 [Portunus trituberculatus]|uniref:Uncharacterized protein n=1 Tax=Portunus trituberculatus TaxID=210409 RepID=A0A5B7K9K3_PORTR|nr:hypothetical protein [Portunus trituberculatus]